MDSFTQITLTVLLLLAVGYVEEARGDAIVTGTVFCDQCKDGKISLFDYPLSGMKVRVSCGWIEKEETTNWFGSYNVRFDGNPDLTGCYAHVLGGNNDCEAAAGPPKQLRLIFRLFDLGMYTVDTLLSQPVQPMPNCHTGSGSTIPPPAPVVPSPTTPTPTFPPIRFFQASACSHEIWTRAEYRCHWRLVQPDTKVVVAFGLIAGRRYGTDLNLWQAIQGRGDIYRTLLREATTALLNSYNSIQFRYPTLAVLEQLNWALMATPRDALLMALRFKRANSGYGNATRCNLTACKN